MTAQSQLGYICFKDESIESIRPRSILNYGIVSGKTKDGGSWGPDVSVFVNAHLLDDDVNICSTDASGVWDLHRDLVPRR
ncbi:hypothetical protein DPV78_003900 [Talaromyces pinophilus]|nr:hypothetical protein DPV78_003900 [Talaromyces pinophilus]